MLRLDRKDFCSVLYIKSPPITTEYHYRGISLLFSHNVRYSFTNFVDIKWLCDVGVHSHLKAALNIVLKSVCGHCDNGYGLSVRTGH